MSSFIELANPWIADLATYEPGRPIPEVARELGFEDPSEIVKLASNENALGPSPKAIKAMRQAVLKMHRYPDGGVYSLRHKLADKLGVGPDQLLAANGSNEVIELLSHVFLGPRTNIVVADRAFLVYRLTAPMFKADVISVPMKDFTHDLDAMLRAVNAETRIVYISNPNNPTGTMVHEKELDHFVEHAPQHVIVAIDEAYTEILSLEDQPDTIKHVRNGRNVVVLRTFSKTYGLAGLRIGYAIAPPECIALFNRVRQPFNVNAMAQAAAEAALDDEEHVKKIRRLVRKGLAYFEEQFGRMGLPYVPSVTNFMLAEVGNGREVFTAMQREGVIVRPVDAYGLPHHIRITVGTKEENERCIRALKKALDSAKR